MSYNARTRASIRVNQMAHDHKKQDGRNVIFRNFRYPHGEVYKKESAYNQGRVKKSSHHLDLRKNAIAKKK